MQPRQDLIEMFSTFLKFKEDRFGGWNSDANLRQSMEKSLAQSISTREQAEFWARYWHQVWRECCSKIAREHLYAYLQESGYYAANKTRRKLTLAEYSLSDYFQMAIAKVDKVLRNFNSQYGSTFKGYAAVAFEKGIIDELRQVNQTLGYGNFSLLRRTSERRLKQSLANYGVAVAKIDKYLLAWDCFKILQAPTLATSNRRTSEPERETWNAIAQLYNNERLSQLNTPETEINPETIQQWLNECATAVRNYLAPQSRSLNAPLSGQETGELQDILPESTAESLLTPLLEQEAQQQRFSQQQEINSILTAALAKLADNPKKQQLVDIARLYYGQQLTQQEISLQLFGNKQKQYVVSRSLAKLKKVLVKELAEWIKAKLHISLNTDVLEQIGATIEEWLEKCLILKES
ncbi:MAG: sigma-70 family RNA polymerase sigma factor [Oscillatoria sp. PMC 1068.18]|nr:sigma-70 family RNA polymerase sigma factor [Oscillatoria sp. PMC 1076.18]MEC4990666.1 sigma-70 family RNA polymerase sigma factor [Oscillatoria sp. PMC 1068.18]